MSNSSQAAGPIPLWFVRNPSSSKSSRSLQSIGSMPPQPINVPNYILTQVKNISLTRQAPLVITNQSLFFLKYFIYLFSDRGEGRERGRETSMCEKNISRLPFACPQLGTWRATQACVLTGN